MSVAKDKDIDIMALCETWLKDTTNPTTASIKSYGYDLVHTPRKDGKRGGGTALVFKNVFTVKRYTVQKVFSSFEYTGGSIKTHTGTVVMFLVVYRPGQMNSIFNEEIDSLLSSAIMKCDTLILSGDLNIDFDDKRNKLYQKAFYTISSYGLQRQVFCPTHVAGRSLDQIFTFAMSKNQLKSEVDVDSRINCALGSDHYPVFGKFSLTFEKKYFQSKTYRKLKCMDHEAFTTELSDIVSNLECSSFSTSVTSLHTCLTTLLDSHAPLTTKRITIVDEAPWFDKEYRDLRKKRRKAERDCKKEDAPLEVKVAYRAAVQDCNALANIKKKQYMTRVIDNSRGNPKALYRMVNSVMDRKQSKPLPDHTTDLKELATEFNSFFSHKISNIRSSMKNVPPPDVQDIPQMRLLHDFKPTDADEIKDIIAESGFKCSPADVLPLKLLKEHFGLMLPVLVDLVNISLKTGSMDGVKLAEIIPLLKGDSLDPNILKNFRPVSNLLFLGKLIERVVLRRFNEHMSKNNLHVPEQSAYKKCHSTETILVRIWNDLLIASEEKSATVVMMLDLSAAFDTVDHGLLLKILRNEIGIRGRALQWFESFLRGRAQRIRLGEHTSDEIIIQFGVPQGSVLGPVLFNVYIRSIYRFVKSLGFIIHGYADDHQIMKKLKPSSQVSILVDDLARCFNGIKHWMAQYFLQLNDSKTQIIVFGPSRVLDEITIRGVNLSGASIRFIDTVKNLGVHMDAALTMETQVVELKKKCFRSLRNICKIRYLLNEDQLKQVVNSLVVSCLDYCNVLYYGVSNRLYHQLQMIQNACAKAIKGKYKHDHLGDDLRNLHWLNIRRRVLFKVGLLAYKAVNGFAPQYLQEMFQYSHHGHSVKLMVPHFKLEKYGRRSFSSIGPRFFNSLPAALQCSSSVYVFKSQLKTFLFNISDDELARLC